jgi:peptidoglycan/xylan/chitin deacetylase (PgdA/CDA1 family)
LIWRIETSEKKIYLTFDDGPVPEITPWVLDTLDQFGAKATFFCVGDNVRKHAAIFDRIQATGHQIGNHSYSHLNGYKTSIRSYVLDVVKARKYIPGKLFRPPYGRIRRFAQRILATRFKIVLWDVLSMDYDTSLEPRQVVRNVIANANPGSIIVFHDNIKADKNLKYALPRLLDYYSKRGFEFVPLPG